LKAKIINNIVSGYCGEPQTSLSGYSNPASSSDAVSRGADKYSPLHTVPVMFVQPVSPALARTWGIAPHLLTGGRTVVSLSATSADGRFWRTVTFGEAQLQLVDIHFVFRSTALLGGSSQITYYGPVYRRLPLRRTNQSTNRHFFKMAYVTS